MTDTYLRIIGCGDAFCTGGRHQTCFQLGVREQSMLIDFGASALAPLRQAVPDLNQIDQILISHLHGDHFGGLPFFLLDAQFASRRQRPLTIAGPPGIRDRITETIELLFPNLIDIDWRFPLTFVEFQPGIIQKFENVKVKPYKVDHPKPSPALAFRLEFSGKVFAFSGDTSWTDTLIDLAHNADLFICECHSYEPNNFGHLDWKTLDKHQNDLKAKRILLTHMSQPMLDRAQTLDPGRFEFAADNLIVTF